MGVIKFVKAASAADNLLTNGNFEAGDTSGWGSFLAGGGASATFTAQNIDVISDVYSGKLTITNGGSVPTDINLWNPNTLNLSILQNMQYELAFSARSLASNRLMYWELINGAATQQYSSEGRQGATIGTADFNKTQTFTSNVTAADAIIRFLFGGDANDLIIDNAGLRPVVSFTKNPVFGGLGAPYKFRQPRDLSDGGSFYSYDKGVLEEFFKLQWRSLPLADWAALDAFLQNAVVGAKNSFLYYDPDGVQHTVRLESIDVDFREIRYQRYAGALTLRKVA